MRKLTVGRTNLSGYFGPHFENLERSHLSELKEIEVPAQNTNPDIIITNSETNIPQLEAKQYFHQTKLIIHPNSGHDNFPVEFINKANFPIIAGNPIRKDAVSEYCLSTITQHFSRPPHKSTWDPSRRWPRKRLKDLKVLVYGKGHIGSTLESTLGPMVQSLHFHDPFKNIYYTENLSEVDIIIFAMSLNATSINFANEDFFQQLKEDVVLINPARGKLINWKDLVSFLTKNEMASAYIDVFPKEPFPLEENFHLKNLFCSCHVAGVFSDLEMHIINFEKNVIKDYLELNQHSFEQKYEALNLKNKIQGDNLI